MKTSRKGQIAVLTGAGGGIGKATAIMLAGLQMKLVLLGGTRPETLADTREKCEALGASVELLPGNLTDPAFLETAMDRACACFGGVDVLINNAGRTLNAPFEETRLEDLEALWAVNVRAPFLLCQKALPYLRKSSEPEIISICSVVAHKGYVNQSAYTMTKHALLGMSKSLANEVYQQNIRVHTICPGGVFTDMVKISRPDLTEEGMTRPEEIADVIEFLLTHRGCGVIDDVCIHRPGKQPFET